MSASGEVAIEETVIAGLALVRLATVDALGRLMTDDRGSFTEAWQTEKMQSLGLPALAPKQMSISRNHRGVIRGIHAEPWDKFIHVVVGRVFAPITDLRTDSATFGQHVDFELDASVSLLVPAGCGNAFQALDDDVVYTYLVTGLYDAALAAAGRYPAVAYDDPDLAIEWPIADAILSDKDRNNPTLKEAFPSR